MTSKNDTKKSVFENLLAANIVQSKDTKTARKHSQD